MLAPSRGRPGNIADLHDAWTATTGDEADLLVAVDDDDPELPGYLDVFSDRDIMYAAGPRLRLVPTLNKLAGLFVDQYFAVGFLGDDHRPRTSGWALRYLDALHELGTGYVYGNDLLAGERLPTQWAQTSDTVRALGAMVPAPLTHMFADNQIFDLGHAIDRIRYLPDVIVEHRHPLAGKASDDDGYREVNDPDAFEADRLVYADWYANRFPADVEKLRALL